MKLYRIKRVTPNTGVVERLTWNGEYNAVTQELPYKECRKFITANQTEIKTYRIAEYANRQDAARHLLMTIFAFDEDEAMTIFADVDLKEPKRRRELLSGDWKLITKNYEMR